ncbi:MAG: ParB N-terminal domain-containing protein [Rhodospirillaceae bacterium]|nr:ParB N-terminal domain-containing protein [Rhodospirillaceae bacterium]MBT4938214.1 ParB N-terminal domain-containing protein [Rhodospirillaceae bacterium]MBT5940117.1 ParB N-terminal domain-containing protein [Rhodospirillaceae bacterium]MBT7265402.1 ParB N-terminal domain-containing protein [Rhodospirillaceae bacterium]
MLKPIAIKIDDIYVPADRRKELDPDKVETVAEEIMEEAEEQPIMVRQGKDRYVLTRGVHRLEARKALGEETIQAIVVGAKLH